MPLIKISEYAKKKKVSTTYIYAMIKDKRLDITKIGRFNMVEKNAIISPLPTPIYDEDIVIDSQADSQSKSIDSQVDSQLTAYKSLIEKLEKEITNLQNTVATKDVKIEELQGKLLESSLDTVNSLKEQHKQSNDNLEHFMVLLNAQTKELISTALEYKPLVESESRDTESDSVEAEIIEESIERDMISLKQYLRAKYNKASQRKKMKEKHKNEYLKNSEQYKMVGGKLYLFTDIDYKL